MTAMKIFILFVASYISMVEGAYLGAMPAHYDYRTGVPGMGRQLGLGSDVPGGGVAPVGVGADYAFFASQLGQNPLEMYGLYTGPLSGYANTGMGVQIPQNQEVTTIQSTAHVQHTSTSPPVRQNADLVALLNAETPTNDPSGGAGIVRQYMFQPPETTTTFAMGPAPGQPAAPPTTHTPVPQAQQQVMTNLFIAGVDKAEGYKQFFHPDSSSGSPDKVRGVHPIPGLTDHANSKDALNVAANTPPMPPLRSPCDPLVDVVFALDDARQLWLARDAIRSYVTQLRPQGKARFGVVLCGDRHSFYTALHQHFSGLLASLEDLQHANVTIDVTYHMPDTPGTRADNNPYPPSVSEDFVQTTAGCMETAYFMFMYQAKDHAEKLLALVPTKERWGRPEMLEEARYLQSFNISMLVLADGALSTPTLDLLHSIPRSPDRFRVVTDSVTLHALPAIIGDAVCRPQKADVTIPIKRTSITELQSFKVLDCYRKNSTALERVLDFGHHFGHQTEAIVCSPGMTPDPTRCACVGL